MKRQSRSAPIRHFAWAKHLPPELQTRNSGARLRPPEIQKRQVRRPRNRQQMRGPRLCAALLLLHPPRSFRPSISPPLNLAPPPSPTPPRSYRRASSQGTQDLPRERFERDFESPRIREVLSSSRIHFTRSSWNQDIGLTWTVEGRAVEM